MTSRTLVRYDLTLTASQTWVSELDRKNTSAGLIYDRHMSCIQIFRLPAQKRKLIPVFAVADVKSETSIGFMLFSPIKF